MALLDTTVYVDIHGRGGAKRRAEAEEMTRRLLRDGETLVTSRLNVAEIYVGLELGDDPAYEKLAMENYFAWVAVLDFDDAAARQYARVRAALQKSGNLVGDMDILIGAVALANGHAVVTRNTDHFAKMPGLTVIGYGS
jgi:tRNA(fMet)-specific endonuclease VapC